MAVDKGRYTPQLAVCGRSKCKRSMLLHGTRLKGATPESETKCRAKPRVFGTTIIRITPCFLCTHVTALLEGDMLTITLSEHKGQGGQHETQGTINGYAWPSQTVLPLNLGQQGHKRFDFMLVVHRAPIDYDSAASVRLQVNEYIPSASRPRLSPAQRRITERGPTPT